VISSENRKTAVKSKKKKKYTHEEVKGKLY
jgi:hypothetical protein